jgi:hypothetical protein
MGILELIPLKEMVMNTYVKETTSLPKNNGENNN